MILHLLVGSVNNFKVALTPLYTGVVDLHTPARQRRMSSEEIRGATLMSEFKIFNLKGQFRSPLLFSRLIHFKYVRYDAQLRQKLSSLRDFSLEHPLTIDWLKEIRVLRTSNVVSDPSLLLDSVFCTTGT